MELDTSFLGTAAAPAESAPTPESATPEATPEVSVPVADQPQEPAVPAPADQSPEADPAVVPPAADLQEEATEPEISDEDIDKLLADEKSPKWFRDQLKNIRGYTNKLKTERDTHRAQFEELQQTYESSRLPETDLERMRAAEERQYRLSSFNADAGEILGSLQEIVPQQKFEEVKSHLAWGFLETSDGQPDLDNLQVVIDRFTGYQGGDDKRVQAKDVINALTALKRGTIDPSQLHEFTSDAEYQAYEKARAMEAEISEREARARANAEFQETQTRMSVLQNVNNEIQDKFRPQVESLLDKFQLSYVPGEPQVAADFKTMVQQRIAATIQEAQNRSPHLTELRKGIELLQRPTGANPENIQNEIRRFTDSFNYQTSLSRGLNELIQAVEKTVAEEAYRYSLLMEGYKVRASKGQEAREIVNAPNQTDVMSSYTPEQLAQMTARQRREAVMTQVSEQLRESQRKGSRFGG